MKRTVFGHLALGIVLFSAASFTPQRSWACGGTFRPNCGQTAWLAKFISSSIVLPGSGAAITVPIGLLPYVLWNPASPCAQPNSDTLELTLTCTAVGGGAPIVIGPTSVPIGVPSVPGAQPVLTGAGGSAVLGGPFLFPISGGTLPVGTSYSCLVEGSFTIGFGSGTGSPQITGVGDTEVCIVEEAPGSPGIPRFDFRLIDENEGPFSLVRRGDQARNRYFLANNDPDETLDLKFRSTTNQVARMPQGDDPDTTLFALSNPAAGTDDFIQSRVQNLPPGGLIPLPDPTDPNPGLTFDGILGPHEIRIYEIATRSHGMCADGSCSEALLKGTGTFSNGDLILGCAGTAILVDDVPARSHQCEITDTVHTDDTVDTFWSLTIFDDDPHLATHFAGNLDPVIDGPGTRTTGPVLAEQFDVVGFPPEAFDILRSETPPNRAFWSADVFDQAENFAVQHTEVTIDNLDGAPNPIRIPSIAEENQAPLDVLVDAGTGQFTLVESGSGTSIFEGPFDELVNSPPPGISIDQNTFREISKTGPPSQPLLGTLPREHSSLHAPTDPMNSLNIKVLDPRNNQPLAWTASSDNPLVTLSATSGNAGEDIVVNYDPSTIAVGPDITIALVEVTNPQAINSPVQVPIALRSTTAPAAQTQDINYGLGGGWFNTATSGQGFLSDFLLAEQLMFVAGFTFDSLGAPGGSKESGRAGIEARQFAGSEQRWFTAQGNYSGNRANLTIFQTRNGVFDDPAPVTSVAVGSMEWEFLTCTEARVTYDMPGLGLSGVIPVVKLLADEICTQINDGDIVLEAGGNSGAASAESAQDTTSGTSSSSKVQDINYGMIGGWFEPATSGQGFLFDFLLDQQLMFVAGFTFDTISPQAGGNIPGAEQRWFTAQGNYAGNRADLEIFQTRNGVFDDPTPVVSEVVGTMVIEAKTCTTADITYDMPGLGLSGVIPVVKLLADEICTQIGNGDIVVGR